MSTTLQTTALSTHTTLALTQFDSRIQQLLTNPKPYQGFRKVELTTNEQGALSVSIQTERLTGRYLTEDDINDIIGIYGSNEVMAKYSKGSAYPAEHAIKRTNGWIEEAKKGNPWTAIKFTDPKTEDFIVVFVEPDYVEEEPTPGDLEITYFAPKSSWGKGYAKEATTVIIENYIPETIRQGFKVEGSCPTRLHLTARSDNPGSIRVAVDCGMTYTKTTGDVIDPNDGTNWGPRLFFERKL